MIKPYLIIISTAVAAILSFSTQAAQLHGTACQPTSLGQAINYQAAWNRK